MLEATVRVEREQPVDAAPEKVWELVRSMAALSAMPERFAFAVPGPLAGTDRLCCLLVRTGNMHCAVLDVRDEVPDQAICWQTRNTQPSGRQLVRLSVLPRSAGSAIHVAVSDVVPWSTKGQYDRFWRSHLEEWTGRLQAIAENRMPWPSATLPAEMREAAAIRPPLERPVRVSAGVLIKAAVPDVWAAVWAAESVRLIDPEHVAYAGHVPGTPEQEAGEMQYMVRRHPGDRFTAAVHVVRELTREQQAVTQHLGPPHDEVVHTITPARGGTCLELECRWSADTHRHDRKRKDSVAKKLRAMAEGYRDMVESPDAP
ncbi:MAG: hypothetical protein JO345_12655 [Streptosporangiaceae bacterium]|nr:hypothetical protein [Streptosporangiaceae bacterium]